MVANPFYIPPEPKPKFKKKTKARKLLERIRDASNSDYSSNRIIVHHKRT